MYYFPRRYFFRSYKFLRISTYDNFRFLGCCSQIMCQAAWTTCSFYRILQSSFPTAETNIAQHQYKMVFVSLKKAINSLNKRLSFHPTLWCDIQVVSLFQPLIFKYRIKRIFKYNANTILAFLLRGVLAIDENENQRRVYFLKLFIFRLLYKVQSSLKMFKT